MRRVTIVIPISKNCFVYHYRFKRHMLCFELKSVEKYDVLEIVFSKRLETKAELLEREHGRTKIGNFIELQMWMQIGRK